MSFLDTVFDDGQLSGSDIDLVEELIGNDLNLKFGPRFKEINWSQEFIRDMKSGKGFIIKEKPFDSFNKSKKNYDGSHSPRFGTTWEDENAFAERYRCKCGKMIGKIYEGEICPECHKPVEFVDTDLDVYGWYVLLHDFYLVQPAMYKKLESFIGEKVLSSIFNFKYEMGRNGYFRKPEDIPKNASPWYGIGPYRFKKEFNDIMEYYKKQKKSKRDLYDNIMQNYDKIFTKHIPVYSAILRPVFLTNEDYSYTKIDRKYNSLFANIKTLNKEPMDILNIEKVNRNLCKAQEKINDIYDLLFDSINQKEGWIRDSILGGRVNFSARNVIVPDATLKADELKLPYLTFLELFQEEIINLIVKMNNKSFSEATEEWHEAQTKFNPKVYEIMNYLIKNTKQGLGMLTIRNPTINFGSALYLKVAYVRPEYDNLTCGVPLQILVLMNADFDGDVINLISIKSNEFKKAFNRILNPRNSFFVDRNTGLFNDQCHLLKDQQIGLFQFNNI